jgi:DNA-directed RNA polymerase subunit K/omega
MLHPTIEELTKGQFNRYELALATAKCARIITDIYVSQREAAEREIAGGKDTDKPLMSRIDKEYRDEKAVKNAITRIYSGEYVIVRPSETAKDAETASTAE